MTQRPLLDFDAAVSLARHSDARLVAIDGLPVSGKSTLAARFETELGAQCIYLDDFVRPETEWRSRIAPAFPFGYIRYDEFLATVRAVAAGRACRYRPYDWASGTIGAERDVDAEGRCVIEGVSSLHPKVAPLYHLRFWVESDAATTLDASLARGVGDWEVEWRTLFLPSTALYMQTKPWLRADHFVAGRGAVQTAS